MNHHDDDDDDDDDDNDDDDDDDDDGDGGGDDDDDDDVAHENTERVRCKKEVFDVAFLSAIAKQGPSPSHHTPYLTMVDC